jgi:glucose-6-phosphate isomerase
VFNFKHPELGIQLDLRRMGLQEADASHAMVAKAAQDMHALEAGAVANPSEGRQVGHYWLRNPSLAPAPLGELIRADRLALRDFAEGIREGGLFQTVLLLGIGGSALGPQLLQEALAQDAGPDFVSIDNTDPEGMARVLARLELGRTLVLVVSKSGGTAETRNACRVVQAAFAAAEVDFASQAVAITGEGSRLHEEALQDNWLAVFFQYPWIGGRTSICSTVGMLPAALMGVDTKAFLAGCAAMDAWCRESDWNPATALAMAWYRCVQEQGRKNLVFLPYKDRLALSGRYLQQLIMESIGKRVEDGDSVQTHGLTVYGNKGSTDQHALVQQLREGEDDFFAAFVAVLDKTHDHVLVQMERTAGDYLIAMLLGTRKALTDAGRASYTLVLPKVDAPRLGALIALHERAVGAYASMLGINAYDQPGVEAGKRCAEEFLLQQDRVRQGQALPGSMDSELLNAWIQAD